jgi:signal recognition particle subunit SRP54
MATFVPFRKLFANIKDIPGMAKGGNMDMASLMGRGGQQNLAKMASAFDPRLLQRVGGMGGLQSMMKQMAMAEKGGKGAGGMPKGLMDMMGSMGGMGGK